MGDARVFRPHDYDLRLTTDLRPATGDYVAHFIPWQVSQSCEMVLPSRVL